jgi:hypothetical protein
VDEDLERLADLVRRRNEVDRAVAELIGRPATPGNIGEFVAARVFRIELVTSGSHPGYDGVFGHGPMAGRTVNIKAYSRHESIVDVGPHPCDYYLVLTGPSGPAKDLPWRIDSIFLFDTGRLMEGLRRRGVKVGVATSVLKADWEAARIFPPGPDSPLPLSENQVHLLSLFAQPPGS